MKLRLGTRGSDLARTQSGWVAAELSKAGIEVELVIISTSGDRSTAPSFGSIGPQGVFVREIEQALIDREIDLAVHSYKDLPTQSPAGLRIAAVPPRRDVADWLLYRQDERPDQQLVESAVSRSAESGLSPDRALELPLPSAARIGTASARRQAWLRLFGRDLDIDSLRGNVPTRLKRLADGDFDAILLAGAGVERLAEASDLLDESLSKVKRLRLDPVRFVPAPAQGALAVQCREDDAAIHDSIRTIDDAGTNAAVEIERAALALAEGGCDSAFGAYARTDGGSMHLSVMTERDSRIFAAEVEGDANAALAEEAIRKLCSIGESRT